MTADLDRRRRLLTAGAVLSLLVLVAGLRAALSVPHGLRVDYFDSLAPGVEPSLSAITREVSTEALQSDRGVLPEEFRARWYGYLAVSQPGPYIFSTTSDDGSSLSIDGTVVVDNGGVRGITTRTGRIDLEAGPHVIVIDYLQAGGFHSMEWAWAMDGERLGPVPSWRLTPNRESPSTLQVLRALDLALIVAAVLAGVVLLMGLWQYGQPVLDLAAARPRLASLLLFALLAIVHTWPLATNPSVLSRNDTADTVLNEWALAWVAHQAVRDPLHLYDANIFYPERRTLAYSEAMIVQSAMGAPLAWAGASPVLVYNVLLIAGFTLTGWVTCLVVARWTGDWSAGVIAGALNGVNAHTLTRLPHLQALHGEFLPLALLALDTLFREPRVGNAVRLAVWFVLQALTSVYLLVFTAFALAGAALARPESWLRGRFTQVVPFVLLAAAIAGLLLAPFLLPYWLAYSGDGFTRSLADARMYSATFRDYLMTPGRLHEELWSYRFSGGTALFPGVVGTALAVVALATGIAFSDLRARMCLGMGIVGVALSFGTRLPGYETLYGALPLLHAIRAPVRFGYLGVVAVALLAGFGAVALRQRVAASGWRPLAALLVAIATLETMAAPIEVSRAQPVPSIYAAVRNEVGAIVAELPLPNPRTPFVNARYMLHSTAHWKPMINGYSGFVPDSYRAHHEEIDNFPDQRSIIALQSLGVTHLFVHTNQMREAAVDALDSLVVLQEIQREGPIRLYRLSPN
ncbi:MAG: PA14 domain-containing protein [Vicinamibacterales bacterium]